MLLDESGSMASIRNDMIGSINLFIQDQQKIDDATTFTLIKFNTQSKTFINKVPLKSVKPLTQTDYTPQGGTALFDAINDALILFGDEQSVIVVIITDGEENSSVRIKDFKTVKDKMATKPESWKFIYLNKGEEAMQQGNVLGINNNNITGKEAFNQKVAQDYIHIGKSAGCSSQGYNTVAIGAALSNECSAAISQCRTTGFMDYITPNKKNNTK